MHRFGIDPEYSKQTVAFRAGPGPAPDRIRPSPSLVVRRGGYILALLRERAPPIRHGCWKPSALPMIRNSRSLRNACSLCRTAAFQVGFESAMQLHNACLCDRYGMAAGNLPSSFKIQPICQSTKGVTATLQERRLGYHSQAEQCPAWRIHPRPPPL
jgi:hypothetical protein